jgi:hypothetical protein
VLVGFTALETALGKVFTGAGRAIGWALLEVGAGFGLLETGAGVVVPIGGVDIVGLDTGLLETGVFAACGVVWAAGVACGVACGAGVGLEFPLATG